MWCMFKFALLLEVVCGVRRVERRSRGPTSVITASAFDAEGHWNATVAPGLFHSGNVKLQSPDGKEYDFYTWGESAEIATQSDTSVLHGFDGDVELTAVETSGGAVAGSIVDPDSGMVHQFIGEKGELMFTSTPSGDFQDEAEPLEDEQVEEEEEESDNSVTLSSDGSVIDVMVLWTKAAECINAGKPSSCSVSSSTVNKIRAKIALAIQETNDAYTRSRIGTKLRLAYSYRANYDEKGVSMGTTLARLTSTNDSHISGVHRMRTQHKADVVALIVGTGDSCGMAYYGPSKTRAFSVTKLSCATGYYSFGHEIGHNMGCRHDRGTMKACTSSQSYYGWRDPNAKWRDILSYACKSGDCMNQRGGSCTRMKFFANPNVKYNNQPTGKTGKADLAKQINAVKRTMSNFY